MIKSGHRQGWLRTPIDTLPKLCSSHGIDIRGCSVAQTSTDHNGYGLIAAHDLMGDEESPIIKVPAKYVLSIERVFECSESDVDLNQILEAADGFVQVPRNAILVFLLYNVGRCLSSAKASSLLDIFPQYFKYISIASLPTSWTSDERAELEGTSLLVPLEAKIMALRREFDWLRTRTEDVPFCKQWWWSESNVQVEFEDWVCLDAMYRSRALELPNHGHCMVMCIDMVNHAYGDAHDSGHLAWFGAKDAKNRLGSPTANARWDIDDENNAVLYILDGAIAKKGEEITISYGEDKSACEFLFTYGFVPYDIATAKSMFLPYRTDIIEFTTQSKLSLFRSRPGTMLMVGNDGRVIWDNKFFWILVLEEEDGFEITIDEEGQQLQALWHGEPIEDLSNFEKTLKLDPKYNVYRYRVLDKLVRNLQALSKKILDSITDYVSRQSNNMLQADSRPSQSSIDGVSLFYRRLELELLNQAIAGPKKEMMDLMLVPIVRDFLIEHPEAMTNLGINDLLKVNKEEVVSNHLHTVQSNFPKNKDNSDDQIPIKPVFPYKFHGSLRI